MNTAQEKFNDMEKKVLKRLKRIWNDIDESVNILRKNNKTLVKSELCLTFIGADTFSRFYEIMCGEEENNNKKRFKLWLDAFVFTDRNKEYSKYKNLIKCDSAIAWKLRNSLLHFYGLPKSGEIGFGYWPENEQKKFKKYIKINNLRQSFRIINPYYLIKAILNGFLLQLLFFAEIIKNDPKKYIDGISKCYKITQRECSEFIDLNKSK